MLISTNFLLAIQGGNASWGSQGNSARRLAKSSAWWTQHRGLIQEIPSFSHTSYYRKDILLSRGRGRNDPVHSLNSLREAGASLWLINDLFDLYSDFWPIPASIEVGHFPRYEWDPIQSKRVCVKGSLPKWTSLPPLQHSCSLPPSKTCSEWLRNICPEQTWIGSCRVERRWAKIYPAYTNDLMQSFSGQFLFVLRRGVNSSILSTISTIVSSLEPLEMAKCKGAPSRNSQRLSTQSYSLPRPHQISP